MELLVDVFPGQVKTAIEVSVFRLKSMPRIQVFASVLVGMPLIGQYDVFVENVPPMVMALSTQPPVAILPKLWEDPDPDPFPDGTKAPSRYSKSVDGPTPFSFSEGMLNVQPKAIKGNVRLPKDLGEVPLLVWRPRWYMSAILRIGQNFAVCGILPLSHSL